jgi:PAS domain S-box-containing protein
MGGTENFEGLYRLSRALHNLNGDRAKLLQAVISHTGELVSSGQGCLVTFREDHQVDEGYIINADFKQSADLWDKLLARGLIGFVYHSQRTVVIRNIANDPRWPRLETGPESGSAIGLPLHKGRHIFGVIMLLHPEIDYFDSAKVTLLEEAADIASTAISNASELQAARTGDRRYQHLFEDAVVPIILADMDGIILDANRKACDLLDADRHNLLQLPMTAIHPLDVETQGTLRSLRPDEERAFRTVAIGLNRQETPVIARVRRLKLGDRDVVEWIEQDVTAQMELEQLRRDLTAMVYHDLRGPLQAMTGATQKLAQVLSNHENPAVLTLLQIGVRSIRQLRRMVDSLLDIQRMEEGRAVLDLQPMELRVLLADATQLVQPLAMEAQQRLKFEFPNNLPMVMIDGDMMVRVVVNLMENAVKYTPTGGNILLKAGVEGDKARISVKDSGPGIPPEMRQTIFDKFNRVKYQNAPKGVGLGLAFCRLAIKEHGGDIWVESTLGSGSEFIFTLPIAKIPINGNGSPEKVASV